MKVVRRRTLILLTTIALIVLLAVFCAGCAGGEQGAADTSIENPANGQPDQNTDQNNNTVAESGNPSAEITQTALQVWKDSIDTIWAHGAIEITNTGDVPIKIGDISISFIGSDNSVLKTAIMILPVPELISPGETSYAGDSAVIENINDPAEVAGIEANIDFDKTDKQPQLLDVQDLKIAPSEFGGPRVTGRVVNTSNENADDIRIVIAMFDDSANLVGIYSDSPDVTVAPGKSMGFETFYPFIEIPGFIDKVNHMVGKSYNWKFDW